MTVRSPSVPFRYFALVCSYADEVGIDRGAVLRQAGLPESLLEHPDLPLTVVELGCAVAAIVELSGRSDACFDFARRITLESHGAFGLALRHCAIVDHALRLLSRYYALITPSFLVEYRRDSGKAEVTYRPTVGMAHAVLATLNEVHAVSFHFVLQSAAGRRLPAYDIYLPMAAPPHAQRYTELAPARVHFGASNLPEVRVVLDPATADMAMAMPDSDRVAMTVKRLEHHLPKSSGESPWSDWVRLVLREAEECQPTIPQVSALLRLPPHTLARRLADEGWRFRDLANAVRHERSCRLLRQGEFPIAQIAHRLGYSGVPSFSKAFRKVGQTSPQQYRKAVAFAAPMQPAARGETA